MHIPVLLEETISALEAKPGGRYVDGTLGRAGHAKAIVARGGEVLGIDRDVSAIAAAEGLEGVSAVHGRHGDIASIVSAHGWDRVDGVLLDLGASSPQLDEASRGFSFMHDGPLDMRMDRTRGETAADIVNGAAEPELARIFREYGEEPDARRIAGAVCRERAKRPIRTTSALADIVGREKGRRGARNPATRVFQALRMAVNDETGELGRALDGGLSILKPGGRFAVITFESLTDRMVKRFFALHAGRMVSLQQGGAEWTGETPRVRLVTRRAVRPGEDERRTNARSRSAKLRVAERMPE